MSLLSHVQSLLPDLSPSERKVAELVLQRPVEVVSAPIAQIAIWAEVSQPTVIRFCRRFGVAGLPEFKLQLAGELGSGVPFVHAGLEPGDSADSLTSKVFDTTLAGLRACRTGLDSTAVERAVDLLDRASRIECYGLGNSGVTALDAQMKLFRLGTPTVSCIDPQMQRMAAVLLPRDSVVLAFSNSGRTTSLLEVVDLARKAGAMVVAITRSRTPLAQRADLLLAADVPENPEVYAPMVSRIAHLCLVDVLTVGLALRRGPESVRRMEAAKAALKATQP